MIKRLFLIVLIALGTLSAQAQYGILVNGKVVNALGEMKIDGNAMTLKVTRKALRISQDGAFRFEFKFIDSTEPCRDPLDWYDHGVVEPLGRVPFVYKGECGE